ncbi:hypothetical protein [Kushneria phosphatilytica]|uniref:Uncharacterized protein n=1 Tax=Kushneria phosphatilytica TaxID=657387 RepID=A0A1S1NRY1_9GAMM|nr:hypothetical protein [Kushneria phosphatilytica]OHV07689.1 hypothetical protein BH688_15995 [Kushneria phosphatilytica]QEL10188.1 hypothetical protein FY550_02930 [Kushneria phosphatilytica]
MADPRQNAAWRMAEQLRANTRSSTRNTGGFKLLVTWLAFGLLLIVGTVLALCFLLIGWAMMPLLRHRMKRQAERFGQTHEGQYTTAEHDRQVLEGEYHVHTHSTRR